MGNTKMASARIIDFLNTRRPDGPCLVVDLDVVRDNFKAFRHALPDSAIYYAVKANPAPEVLSLLASMGSCFDCASVQEIQMALDAGATPERVSFGNTIKKERDIARAFALGRVVAAAGAVLLATHAFDVLAGGDVRFAGHQPTVGVHRHP